jgi:vacuolar-type H+-ATPase catalytic subunit A/Vma1
MVQIWPVKVAIKAYAEKFMPTEPLVTKMRLIDSLFPVARGGTYCVPGPFGAGKTVLQQLISRHADVDIVIIAACGERAGEVVETLKTFPELKDPKTGKPLSDRTVIICNTSSMPVAARESSVYTAVTIAEYYRQMGLNVMLWRIRPRGGRRPCGRCRAGWKRFPARRPSRPILNRASLLFMSVPASSDFMTARRGLSRSEAR